MSDTIQVPSSIVEAFLHHVQAGLEGIDYEDLTFETRDEIWHRFVALISSWYVDQRRYGCWVPLPTSALNDEPVALDMLEKATPEAVRSAREALADQTTDHP